MFEYSQERVECYFYLIQLADLVKLFPNNNLVRLTKVGWLE
jgi:hypothetical protein